RACSGFLYLCHVNKLRKMSLQLRQSLFWDSDVRTIDLQKHKAAIIERIITRGHLDEFRTMMEFYGKDVVKEVVLNARWLDKVTLAFCCTIFDVPKTAFRCYRLAQSNPEHWSY
ncbi:MAG: DUF6922 domain-containing protein, partial [Bacteroidota bacterium]